MFHMCHATEQRSYEQVAAELPIAGRHAQLVLTRLRQVVRLPTFPHIVDVGAAQGSFLNACARLGCDAVGIEPWEQARLVAALLAAQTGTSIHIVDGTAEELPLPSSSYDIVHANSVIEHVDDAQAAFREAYRVLKPGGAFWFSAASSLCPRQQEIRGFPAFGWYPDMLKRAIMRWACAHRPHLLGHTTKPAMNWFTPWKARRMLHAAGFSRVYDRWDLRLPSEGGRAYGIALRAIRASAAIKLLADVLVPCCAYAAVK